MMLLTRANRAALHRNAKASAAAMGADLGHRPVVKLFTPWGSATWLLSELDQDGIAFGLCDLGMGEPELGYVSLAELTALRGPFGLRVERDLHFKADKTLTEYADAAYMAGSIAA
jgi:hypothetical protein